MSGTTGCDMSPIFSGLARMRDTVVPVALRSVDVFGFVVVLGSAQQLCPVLTGFLQSSATDEPADLTGWVITKLVGFNASYAAAVHENLTAHHDIGQAKYLETTVRIKGPELPAHVAADVKEALG